MSAAWGSLSGSSSASSVSSLQPSGSGSSSGDIHRGSSPSSTTATLIGGRTAILLGSTRNRVFVANRGDLDGPSQSISGTVTSAGIESLSDTSQTFTSGLIGLAVQITRGKGAGQQRIISAVSGSTLRLMEPWIIKPDTTSRYQVAGISWSWRSGWFRWMPSPMGSQRAVEVAWVPTSQPSTMIIRRYRNGTAVPTPLAITRTDNAVTTTSGSADIAVSTDNIYGIARQPLVDVSTHGVHGREWVAVELAGVTSGERHRVHEIIVEGAAQ
jgi:hypothetical protein